jgi:hypothetical protein
MKLIGSLASPYVRKVRVVMAEKKLDYAFELENVWTAETRIHESNPLGKVPCLIMEDGSPCTIRASSSNTSIRSRRCASCCRPMAATAPTSRCGKHWPTA